MRERGRAKKDRGKEGENEREREREREREGRREGGREKTESEPTVSMPGML